MVVSAFRGNSSNQRYKWLHCAAKDDLTVNADLISRLLKSDNLERGHPAVEEYCLKATRRSTSRLIIRERQPNQMLHLLCCTSSATSSASPLLSPPHIAYRFALCGQPSGPSLLLITPIDLLSVVNLLAQVSS